MNKTDFIHVLQHYNGSSLQEAEEVLSLAGDFPYSQVLHTLSARVSQDHGFNGKSQELQMAAVYAADRAVLKEIMSVLYAPAGADASRTAVTTIDTILEESAPITSAQSHTSEATHPRAVASGIGANEDLAEEIIHDLEKLNQLRHNFEMMFVEVPPATLTETTTPKSAPVHTSDPGSSDTATHKEHKSKRERMIELARSLNGLPPEPEPTKSRRTRKKKDEPGDELIHDIITSKEAIASEPENDRQREQFDLIDQFIKTQPSIAQSKDKPLPPPSGDLATIKTGEFGDHVVSETLVEILIKQGKKDKAIEVLKKLIWKFPQKKAYFAAQIEELRK